MISKQFIKILSGQLFLAFSGFLQVFLVSANIYFIANYYLLGVIVMSFSISMVWAYNVKRISFGSMNDRVVYSLGAMTGSILGLYVSRIIIQFI